MSTKFAVIDQSVKGEGGHHLEYALRALEAAAEEGFEPVLGAGQKFEGGRGLPFSSFAIFRHSFWENLHRQSRLAKILLAYGLFRHRQRERARLKKARKKYLKFYSRTGLDRQRALDAPSIRHEVIEIFASDLSALPSKRRDLAFYRYAESCRVKLIHARSWAVGLYRRLPHALRYPVFVARKIFGKLFRFGGRQLRRLAKVLVLLLAAPFGIAVYPFVRGKSHRAAFRDDLQAFVRRAGLQAGDIAFIPTLGETEMLGFADLCESNPHARKISWRLLFRRDLYSGRSVQHGSQNDEISVRRFRLALEETKHKTKGVDLRFYTDTDLLTEQYNTPRIFKFDTLPIPVGANFIPATRDLSKRPLTAGYLGDARDEKGYPLLADALNNIYDSHIATGAVRLMAQSNYNLESGEPGSIAAKLALMALPPQARELPEGPLGSKEYAALFNKADILLIPYDAEAYASRSSGVFAEALAAGRPTLVTRGSWMATILEPYKQAYLQRLESSLSLVNPMVGDIGKRAILNRRTLSEATLGHVGTIWSMPRASHLFVRLDFPRIDSDMHVTATVRYYDTYERLIESGTQTAWLDRKSLRLFIPVPEKTDHAKVEIVPLDGIAKAIPDQTLVQPVNLPKGVPHSFGGCIVDPDADQVAGGIREIADNFTVYQMMARALSEAWGPYCMAETLVAALHDEKTLPKSPEHGADYLVSNFFESWEVLSPNHQRQRTLGRLKDV